MLVVSRADMPITCTPSCAVLQNTLWEQVGSKTMEQRVEARVRKLLTAHPPAPFPEGAVDHISKVLALADARMVKK